MKRRHGINTSSSSKVQIAEVRKVEEDGGNSHPVQTEGEAQKLKAPNKSRLHDSMQPSARQREVNSQNNRPQPRLTSRQTPRPIAPAPAPPAVQVSAATVQVRLIALLFLFIFFYYALKFYLNQSAIRRI